MQQNASSCNLPDKCGKQHLPTASFSTTSVTLAHTSGNIWTLTAQLRFALSMSITHKSIGTRTFASGSRYDHEMVPDEAQDLSKLLFVQRHFKNLTDPLASTLPSAFLKNVPDTKLLMAILGRNFL